MSLTMSPTEVAAILWRAAEIMIEGGIVRGMRYDSKGAHCALGAIESAGAGHLSPDATVALSRMLPESLPNDPYNPYNRGLPEGRGTVTARIASWSNNVCARAEDVACMMRATAELLEEEAAEPPTKEVVAKDAPQ